MASENRELVPVQNLVATLATRDLEACIQPVVESELRAPRILGIKLYEPRFWNRVGYWIDRWIHGRKESPTYHAVTDRIDTFSLLLTLAQNRAIRNRSVQDIADGWMRIAALDQLSISQLPEDLVIKLDDEGFGLWPVIPNQGFSEVDWGKLRLDLTPDQLLVLNQAQDYQTRAVKGLWFQDERLTSDNRPLLQDYLPTAVEVLKAFETFHDQEGYYPHSRGKWFMTSSTLQASLTQAYEDVFFHMSSEQILREILIRQSDSGDEIKRYLSMPSGDFVLKRSGGGWVRRRGDELRVTDDYDERTLQFRQKGKGNLFVRSKTGYRLRLEDDIYTVRDYDGVLTTRLSSTDLIQEIEVILTKARPIFAQAISFPIVLHSDRKQGVQVGISSEGTGNTKVTYYLAEETLTFNVLSMLRPFINREFHDLNVLENTHWPRIFPDQHAGYLYQ